MNMKMKKAGADAGVVIEIMKVNTGRFTAFIVGDSPLIYNAMSQKAKQGLLAPSKKTAAEKASTAKHDPLAEYRGSFYKVPSGPTLLSIPAVSFKRAMASAALDLGGAAKAQLDRLVWAIGEQIPVWGVPQLRMDVVRLKDIARTPDIRTRGCLRDWCTRVELAYVEPVVNATTVANLLAGAGLIRGVGDFRQEKGAGNYGQFSLREPSGRWEEIVKSGGRDEQLEALNNPTFYNDESQELFSWWESEMKRRGTMTKAERDAELLDIDEGEDVDDSERGIVLDRKGNGAHL
jgi:hypothetical protein